MFTAISWGKGEIFGAKDRELILAMATDEISALNDKLYTIIISFNHYELMCKNKSC